MKTFFFSTIILIIYSAFIKVETLNDKRFAKSNFTDYRDAYTGSYLCNRSSITCNAIGGPTEVNDTVTITVSKDIVDSILKVAVGLNKYSFKLNSGSLIAFPFIERRRGEFFAIDSIRLYIASGKVSALSYTGKKK